MMTVFQDWKNSDDPIKTDPEEILDGEIKDWPDFETDKDSYTSYVDPVTQYSD